MTGQWRDDADTRVRKVVGRVRRAHWGTADIVQCLLKDTVTQLAVRYQNTPTVYNKDDVAAIDKLTSKLYDRWIVARELQKVVESERDGWLMQTYNNDTKRLYFTVVPPHRWEAWGPVDRPTKVTVWSFIPLSMGEGKAPVNTWVGETWDITNRSAPQWTATTDDGTDVSRILAKSSPGYYPWVDSDGPFIPGTVYHASANGCMYDPYHGTELVEASLNVAVYRTLQMHIVRGAAFALRWLKDVAVTAGKELTAAGTSAVDVDPNTFLMLKDIGNTPGSIGQLGPAADPSIITGIISAYTAAALFGWGISAREQERLSSEPQSGIAIALTRSAVRERQATLGSVYAHPDVLSLELSARMLNLFDGANLPVTGWGIAYADLPLSADEQIKSDERFAKLREQGLMSRADHYAAIFNVPREIALQEIARIEAEDKQPAAADPVVPGNTQ